MIEYEIEGTHKIISDASTNEQEVLYQIQKMSDDMIKMAYDKAGLYLDVKVKAKKIIND